MQSLIRFNYDSASATGDTYTFGRPIDVPPSLMYQAMFVRGYNNAHFAGPDSDLLAAYVSFIMCGGGPGPEMYFGSFKCKTNGEIRPGCDFMTSEPRHSIPAGERIEAVRFVVRRAVVDSNANTIGPGALVPIAFSFDFSIRVGMNLGRN